jgi:hypothetical protein
MKCEAPVLMEMNEETLRELVTEVKETIALNIQPPKSMARSFGLVDMWNIRRKTRSASAMLYRRRL